MTAGSIVAAPHHDRRLVLLGLSASLALAACADDPPPASPPVQRKAALPAPEIILAEEALDFDASKLAELTQGDIEAIKTAHSRVMTEGQARRLFPHVEIWLERSITYRIAAAYKASGRLPTEALQSGAADLPGVKQDLLYRALYETIEDLWTRYGNMDGEWPRLLNNLGGVDDTLFDRELEEFRVAIAARGD